MFNIISTTADVCDLYRLRCIKLNGLVFLRIAQRMRMPHEHSLRDIIQCIMNVMNTFIRQ